MLAALTLALLGAAPQPPDLGAKIQAELTHKLAQAAAPCAELGALALDETTRPQVAFEVAPTGKVKVGKPGPGDAFLALYLHCVVQGLAGARVSARGVTTQLTLDVPRPDAKPVGYAWFADDPKALDRETIVATAQSAWVRCEHADTTLTRKLDAEGFDAVMRALGTAKLEGSNADEGPLWKLRWSTASGPRHAGLRGPLPELAQTLERESGLERQCAPVRKLEEKLPELLEARAPTLGRCLKHRHNELWLTLTLGPRGEVDKADARATSGLDDRALDCLEKVARGWSFPWGGDGRPVVSAHLGAAPPGE